MRILIILSGTLLFITGCRKKSNEATVVYEYIKDSAVYASNGTFALNIKAEELKIDVTMVGAGGGGAGGGIPSTGIETYGIGGGGGGGAGQVQIYL